MATPSIQLRTHFAVPFAEVRVPDSERLCRELTELFLAKEGEGDKWRDRYQRDTQKGIFESGFDLFNWPEPPVQELAKKTHTALVTLVRQLNNYTDEHLAQLRWNYHAWFHITRNGRIPGAAQPSQRVVVRDLLRGSGKHGARPARQRHGALS